MNMNKNKKYEFMFQICVLQFAFENVYLYFCIYIFWCGAVHLLLFTSGRGMGISGLLTVGLWCMKLHVGPWAVSVDTA